MPDGRRWVTPPAPESETGQRMTQEQFEANLLGYYNEQIDLGLVTLEEAQRNARVLMGTWVRTKQGRVETPEEFARRPWQERRPDIAGQPNIQGREGGAGFRGGGPLVGAITGGRATRRRFDPTSDIEFEPAIKEALAGFEGSRPWREWFERSFGAFEQRFLRTLPEFKRSWSSSRIREEKKIREKGWRESLEEAKAGFWDLSSFDRRERPSTFQPMIQTRGF